MLYVIDGNNLLFAAHAHMPGPSVGRQRLCELLVRWAEKTSAKVFVVFDGASPGPGLEQQMRASGLRVYFSAPRSADDVIEEMIQEAAIPSKLHVITSDRAIQSVAKYRCCPCTQSAVFARELASALRPAEVHDSANDRKVTPPEKPGKLKREETDRWLRRFQYDPDEPPDDADLMRY